MFKNFFFSTFNVFKWMSAFTAPAQSLLITDYTGDQLKFDNATYIKGDSL